jgi:hypothetical protein
MKKYIKYIGLVLVGIAAFSCNKDSFNYKPGYVGISKITYYATVITTGDHLVILAQGASYTDAGATSTLNGKTYKYTASGSVDTNTPGVYHFTYTSVNADGYPASDFRTVVVIGNDVSKNNFSGSYARDTNSSLAIWTKTANGVYSVSNPGGAPGTDLTVVVVNYSGNKITIPYQIGSDGSINSSAQESTTPGPNGTLLGYSMEIVNGGYGTQVRNFAK